MYVYTLKRASTNVKQVVHGAAKKAAEHWGLKSTAGIDAHLADKEKVAESPEVPEVVLEGNSMLGEVVKELTEEEFDEAAGEKDACYQSKKPHKVWPCAYASGAQLRRPKVGAKNWGNSKSNGIKYHMIETAEVVKIVDGASLRYTRYAEVRENNTDYEPTK